jgi:hypothetical protein
MRKWGWIAAAMIWATVTATATTARAETVVIRNDGGGNIIEYRKRRAELARAEAVEIRGKCYSACVIFTTLPNACLGPKLQLRIHGTTPKSGIAVVDYWLDMRMGEFLRGEVRRRFEREWRHLGGSKQYHALSAVEYARLDPKVRICAPK